MAQQRYYDYGGGVNDFKCSREIGTIDSTNIDEFYGAYKQMLDKIQKMFPDKKVILATPTYCKCNKDFPKTDGKINDAGFTIKDYAEAVIKLARLYHMNVIPLFEELKWDENNCATYIIDEGEFLHPNKVGGKCMAEIIGRELPQF